MAEDSKQKDTGREDYIINRVANLFGLRKNFDKFRKAFDIEDNNRAIQLFLDDADEIGHLVFTQGSGESVTASTSIPAPNSLKKKILLLYKIQRGVRIESRNVKEQLGFMELSKNVLENMSLLCQEVYLPVLSNPNNQVGWSDLVSKDLIENKFHQFLSTIYVTIGEVRGRTMLPIPPQETTSSERISSKDKAHVLEGAVITWTKQIKNVLKQDPEIALKQGVDPNPLVEIEFWKNKAENLNSIHNQLQSEKIRKVLKFLEQNKSTYTNQFAKLQKEVQAARLEANDNYKFLKTLEGMFSNLVDDSKELTEIAGLFVPIMHTILLIWNHSDYYNTPSRLVVLIREICNAIITQCCRFLSGPDIFTMIQNEETSIACDKLNLILDITSKFKEAYFEYKSRANDSWNITTNALFVRLDAFAERCQDIQHLTNTIVQFTKLKNIEIGGTKGKTLTTSVKQIYEEFLHAVEDFQNVGYNIMDVSSKKFDDDFYEFRCKIKELERRLGSILTQGFDDCDTIYGRFKLLESFEGLLTRPIIQDELEKKHITLLESYKFDLKNVQQIFLDHKAKVDGLEDKAPISKNMPPVTGSINWTRGLMDRIKEPMEKLSSLNQAVLEREEYKDVQKLYASLMRSLTEYQAARIKEWETEVEVSCKDKLKEPLLARDTSGLLKVNFDPALVRLLREVKYFKLINMEVPQSAQEIFAKSETYRTQTGNLDMIISMYNEIKQTLLPVEEPLLDDRIKKMDQTLEPGLRDLKWRSSNINEFIHASMIVVKDVNTTVKTMQNNLQLIKDIMNKWAEKPLIERKSKPISPDDFDQAHKASVVNRLADIIGGGKEINKLMKETGECVKNAKRTTYWTTYVDYVNCIVIEGLVRVISNSLLYMSELLDPAVIKKQDLMPLFDIRIELSDTDVRYLPDIEANARGTGLRNLVHSWKNDFIKTTTLFARIDGNPGDYLIEARDHLDLQFGSSKIENQLDWMQSETAKFKNTFMEYSYLWKEDVNESFEKFLKQDEGNAKGTSEEDEEEQNKIERLKSHPIFEGISIKIPELQLFNDKITQLKYIQSKIASVVSPQDIAWIRVNVEPLKVALNNRVSKWINVYTGFLLNNVTGRMKNLTGFILIVGKGIEVVAEENLDKGTLMKIMSHVRDVRTISDICDNMFVPMREQVGLLKKHGVAMEGDLITKIEDLKTKWEDLKLRVNNVKGLILPYQTEETKNIKEQLGAFEVEVGKFREEFLSTCPFSFDDVTDEVIDNAYKVIDTTYANLLKIEHKAREYNNLIELFELEKSSYRPLKECRQELGFLKTLWDSISLVHYQYCDWKTTLWDKIDTEDLLDQNKNSLDKMVKTLPKELRGWRGYNGLLDKVKNMGTILPLINELHSPSMEPRHWRQLMQITGKTINHTSPNFCLDDLLYLKLHEHEEDVREIVAQSQREATIERKLNNIEAAWSNCALSFETHKDCPVILPLDETIEMLEQHSMELMSMQSAGKSVEYFRERVDKWLSTLKTVESVLGVWIKVQRNWRRLETIFLASEDIRSQLPDQTKLFEGIDNDFRDLMSEVRENNKIIEATTYEGREELLDGLLTQIETCESALNEYLEGKKKIFPRFYFVSNQALLEILSNGNNPHKVCEYLGDCFDGLKALEFEKDDKGNKKNSGVGMYSKEYEYIPFPSKVDNGRFVCEGQVENWLSNLEAMMRKVLKSILEVARQTADMWDIQGEKSREDWIFDYPAQISLVGTQIIWTEEVARTIEEVFVGSESAMKDYFKVCSERIDKLISRVVNPDLTRNERNKIITIITIDVHARDVVDKFAQTKVADTTAFAWQSQLKFEWKGANDSDPNKDCIITICDWRSKYSYEYVGNCGRLVITPLTDRCYITLTQALNLIMGGAPAGPAGTGKTETTKDLGRAVGLPVMVFNCSEQMNFKSMGQIFMGLSQTGAWGCFDEFNRISIEVLSVVSTQVKTVLDALRLKKSRFLFMQEDISLVHTVGFFITMNPGYAGRTELPENLKALFRSCAMVVPDTILICENMLMSEGFKSARMLSNKFVTLYSLSRELLSKQKHYDWGLRAVKSVLRMAGKLRREDPDMDENPLLMRALRDFNLPKIVTDDRKIFLTLISDLFPGLNPESKTNLKLKERVVQVTKKARLQPEEIFISKCIQLSEILEVRHSVFILGPTGCGKSEVWKMLAAVDGAETAYETINPKAVTSDELFGAMTKTKEWKDGVLSVVMRDMCRNQNHYKATHKNKWIVLDGDIDPKWIESLNTVMDDNKVLTLVSNERIPLTDAMRLVFEISHLKNATPATVSRAGVLYINDSDIGVKPFIDSWLETVEDDIARSHFMLAYQQVIENNMEEIHKYKSIVPNVDMSMIQTLCCILKSLITSKNFRDLSKNMKEDEKKACYDAFFMYAGMWSIGGCLGDDRLQAQFGTWWRHISKKLPENGSVFDYYFEPSSMTWMPWSEKLTEFIPMGDQPLSNVIVPTVDIIKVKYLIDLHVTGKKPTMFVGGSGTGKTTIVKDYLAQLNAEEVVYSSINFNNYTDSLALQRFIEGKVEKRMGREYGPPANKQLIFSIDDLNMPFVDEYGTQSPIALIIQLINYGQMYDRDHLEEQKRVKDIQFMACMNPKAGSFTVDTRLQRHFTTFACLLPSVEILTHIYKSILGAHLSTFDISISKLCDKTIKATIDLFKMITDNPEFSPSARKFHYQFNLRDISRVISGVMQSAPSLYRGSPIKFVRLWIHECDRIYLDRLITDKDIETYKDYLAKCGKIFEEDCQGEDMLVTPNIYTSFVSAHGNNDKNYLPIKDMAQLKRVLEDKLNEYNESNAVMNLVLFDLAMEHVCRITRIIDLPGGNALLVGVGGSGKQSLSKLASFILGYEVIQILVSDKYGLPDLKVDIQEMYKKAAVKAGGNPCVFLMTDTQITDEKFLILINDMLSSGYVQDLFAKDELDGIFSSLRNEAKAAGYMETPDQMLSFFIDKARKNLHIVLCFSPVSDDFRKRARKFPGIISCTTIDWFHGWPREALVDVGYRFLQDVELPTDELRQSMSNYMADIHISVNEANKVFLARERRRNYTTPKSFLELIAFFKKLLGEKRATLKQNIDRLEMGLSTLEVTQNKVEGLKKDLDIKMEEVKQKSDETNILIDKVTASKAEADKEQVAASKEEEETTKLTNAANAFKEEAQRELTAAEPAMARAKAAVDCLTKQSIQELKALTQPPKQVLDVTKAVQLMKGEKRNFAWPAAQKMMNNPPKFIEELVGYNKEEIDEWILSQLQPIIALPWFNEQEMKGKSVAASYLCAWVVNVVEYNRIYQNVKPLMKRKAEAEEEASKKEGELLVVRAKVKEVTDKVEALEADLRQAIATKEKVEAEAEECAKKLELAQRLVNGLGGEKKRWGENVAKFKEDEKTIVGDSLLAASFVSYIGPFSSVLRLNLWQETWLPGLKDREVPYTPGVDPLRVLCTESDEAKWKNDGLPADRMSIENASIVTSCSRWPLIIDPQLQGSKWIRGMHGEVLEVIQPSQDRWIKRLESCIQLGKIVMMENLGQELDPILEPLLARSIIKKGRSSLFIKLGSEEIEYNADFKLYLQTKLTNPHYRPEIAAQCTIINFIVTESGLEDQLLATVVNIEKPELEASKTELVRKQNEFKVILAQLEEQLLSRLSAADPSTILSNIELIEGLEKTKQMSEDIKEQTIAAQQTEIEINKAREVYRRVSAEGAMLYFLIIALYVVNHMYQYSLESFTSFFLKAIDKTPQYEEIEQRVLHLRENIRMTIYQWVSRGLFEKHKQLFLMQITLRLMQKGVIDTAYDSQMVSFLLKCPLKPGVEKPQSLDWLPDNAWSAVQKLIEIEEFQAFATNMEKDAPTRFKEWFNELAPEHMKLPLDWKRLDNTPFQKLLVLRCLRPDRLTTAISDWIRDALPNGKSYVDMDQGLSFMDILTNVLDDATNTTPIFFILSPGTDPVADVERIGKRKHIEEGKNYWNVAMGQGTEDTAMRGLENGHKEGHWVMLQNIHLMPKWLSLLEKKLDMFASEGSNMNFRLFLSAEPSKEIPISILDRSIKLTNEPPQGMKANLKRAFAHFNREEFNEKDPRVKAIMFGLCFFHATVLERRKFGPKGWNMHYPFSMGDLRDSSLVLMNYLENAQGSSKVPWDDLRYIFGEIMYGGHIVDDLDRKLCNTYLQILMDNPLLDETELFPFSDGKSASFRSPPPNEYHKYVEYIDEYFPPETPLAFGMHPNAEIGFRTAQCQFLFNTLLELQPRDEAAAEEGASRSKNEIAQEIVTHILEDMGLENLKFDLDDIKGKIPEEDEKMCFINVFLQECEYMNILLIEMIRSLHEIQLALNGELTPTEQMEATIDSLVMERVPVKWVELAYPSCRSLTSWLVNLQSRIEQLSGWKDEPINIPKVTNISRLFNPQSFLTAVKQYHAQRTKSELNKLFIQTDITKRWENEIEGPAREGAYVSGLNLEGARWDITNNQIEESKPKEMFCPIPIVNCKAQIIPPDGKEEKNVYLCPVYKTENRGNTYVFTAQLKTPRYPPAKWVLAGVAIIMDVEGIGDTKK